MPPVVGAVQGVSPAISLTATSQEKWDLNLMRAVAEKLPQKIEEAVRAGANINVRDDRRYTPLMNAVHNGDIDSVRKLKELGADLKATGPVEAYTALMMAANSHLKNHRDEKIVYALLEGNPDVSFIDHADSLSGRTALMIALDAGKYSIARKLILAGADVNRLNSHGYSALTYSAMTNDMSTMKFLLRIKNVIPINEVWRAADLAFKNGHVPMFVHLWDQAINNTQIFINTGIECVIPEAVRRISEPQRPASVSSNANMDMIIANNPGPDPAAIAPRKLIFKKRTVPADAAMATQPAAAVKRPASFAVEDDETPPSSKARNPTETTRDDDVGNKLVQLPSP